ncbi:AP-2 complex subunit alpha [Yarrowia sp. E02]|nr:AP-2 complex subunit alpha [Yarrowia sp. E02]
MEEIKNLKNIGRKIRPKESQQKLGELIRPKEKDMKGLTQFIADLRNARAREMEEKRVNQELANIRQKFTDPNLSGYQKKKYVGKLLYIYILGYKVDFGHLECVKLINSTKLSEKQMGYIALSVLINEDHELVHMVINSVQKDLDGMDEMNNCLALHLVATVGSEMMGSELNHDVYKLLISPTSSTFVRKKASLALLRLFRKNPNIVEPQWYDRIIALIDDPDLGVATSVCSLAIALVQHDPEGCATSHVRVVRRLYDLCVNNQAPRDYIYYGVQSPWLLVKMLKLLQYYPPPDSANETTSDMLRQTVLETVDKCSQPAQSSQQSNAQHAVLFEAINLCIHLDMAPDAKLLSILGEFISSKETNLRYLALTALARLAARYEVSSQMSENSVLPVKKFLVTVLGNLKDKDISIRRKSLDVLYCVCDSSNVKTIVAELLKYLVTADFAIREEMVIKIAVLVEKYATEYKWYVDISLKLIAVAGAHVSEEVWQRVVQIVVNNESLQQYASQTLNTYLAQSSCQECMVKTGAYVLGEYGDLLTEVQPIQLFYNLHSHFRQVSSPTKAMLLSTYIKLANMFPDIKPHILRVLTAYTSSADSEIQQRAIEYVSIIQKPELLKTICDEMPPFEGRTSALLSRLHARELTSQDQRSWGLGKSGKSEVDAIRSKSIMRKNSQISTSNRSDSPFADENTVSTGNKTTPPPPPSRGVSHSGLSPNWDLGFYDLCIKDEGTFFKDPVMQVGLKSEYRKNLGCVILYFVNNSGTRISSLSCEITNKEPDNLTVSTKNFPDSSIEPNRQTQQVIILNCHKPFTTSPTIKITYMAGTLKVLHLKLPIVISKFMTASQVSTGDFQNRWNQLADKESQRVFKPQDISKSSNPAHNLKVMKGFGWSIDAQQSTRDAIYGAGVLYTSVSGNFGLLGCLQKLQGNQFSITIRGTNAVLPAIVAKCMSDYYQDIM